MQGGSRWKHSVSKRLSSSKPSDGRYKKIVAEAGQIESVFVDVFLQLHRKPPKRIVLDIDATDDPLQGGQLGKFSHGYYKSYLLPAAVHILWRPSLLNIHSSRTPVDWPMTIQHGTQPRTGETCGLATLHTSWNRSRP